MTTRNTRSTDMKFEIVVIPVSDVDRAKEFYARLGLRLDADVEVGEVFHSDGVYAGKDEPYLFGRRRVSGPDPEDASYRSFASFRDPDGNGWLFQEVTTRQAGRVDAAATTFASANDLASALRRAEAAHGVYETRIGQGRDANWSDWYAAYMAAEQSGEELPS